MKTIKKVILLGAVAFFAALNVQAEFDPTTGRWASRDTFEEQASVNLYAFLNNDGINQLDYLGECGCCAAGLGFFDIKPFNDGVSFGHDFRVVVSLDYEPCGSGDCTFTWKEKTDRVPPFPASHGAQPNEWYDATSMSGSLPKIKWDYHDTPCPGLVAFSISDTPQIPLGFGNSRVLQFEITLTSSTGSQCPHKSFTITATQTLKGGHGGAIITQTFK
jgi:hypothetical protein